MQAIDTARGLARSWSSIQAASVAILFLVCLGLGGIIAAEIGAPIPDPSDGSAQPSTEQRNKNAVAARPTPFSLPALQSFASVTDRPLFSQSRRPSPQGSDDSLGPWSNFVLAGIIISPASREALVLHGKPQTMVHVQEGQDIDGWLVTSILPDRVVFRGGSTEHELKLIDKVDAGSTPNFTNPPNLNLQRRRPAQ
jgi:type II secretory pathway component PulC